MSMEGNRWVRAETTTFRTMTMAMNTTVIRVVTPPRLILLALNSFFPGCFCFFSFFSAISQSLLSSSGGFPTGGR